MSFYIGYRYVERGPTKCPHPWLITVIKSNLVLHCNVSNIEVRAANRREAFVLVVFVSEHETPCNTRIQEFFPQSDDL